MKKYFNICDSIEICEVDFAGVACMYDTFSYYLDPSAP